MTLHDVELLALGQLKTEDPLKLGLWDHGQRR